VATRGYLWLLVAIRGYLWLSVAICGYSWLSVATRGYPWLSVANSITLHTLYDIANIRDFTTMPTPCCLLQIL
jgi:hypothetical protein